MELAVLIKVVPDLEKLRYDPERKTMLREGSELFTNPFDLRAIRLALDLRRTGEKVTVISMGPPAAEGALREALALGVDRAILVTDRALAGSDTLVTARVLASALGRTGHDLVLTGRWTTDSETGQVGPEVAGLLDVPMASSVRQVTRLAGDEGFDLTTDTDDGWARRRVRPPALLTIGEKAVKIRKPTPPEVEAARGRAVEHLTAAELGFAPGAVGLGGSPTVVVALANEEPPRSASVFSEGPVEERVRAAVERVRRRLGAERPAAPALPSQDPSRDPEREVFVLVSGPDGALDAASLPMLAEVRRTLGPAGWPSAVVVGPPVPTDALKRLGSAGALAVHRLDLGADPASSRRVARALERFLSGRTPPAGGLFLASTFGREVAGQLAARRGLGLTGDAVGLAREPDGSIRFLKPTFGGGVVAGIVSKTRPSLATLRPGALAPAPTADAPVPPTDTTALELPGADVEEQASGREVDDRFGDLDSARVVLVVGMGLGGPDHLPELLPVVRQWPAAALAATRRVVDAGWVPRQLQVGLTGRSLAPDLAVLLGVSGSANHLVGWKRARAILAVNSDPAAPVMSRVDAAVVGRWEEVLPALTSEVGRLFSAP